MPETKKQLVIFIAAYVLGSLIGIAATFLLLGIIG